MQFFSSKTWFLVQVLGRGEGIPQAYPEKVFELVQVYLRLDEF